MVTTPDESPRKIDWPGGGAIRDSLPDGWYTTAQAAQMIGRSADTVKQWRTDGVYLPAGYTERGQLTIYLYSEMDIDNMKDVAANRRPGRPRKEVEDETGD